MNQNIKYIISFSLGSLVGTFATYIYSRKKFESRIDKEFEAIKRINKSGAKQKQVSRSKVNENSNKSNVNDDYIDYTKLYKSYCDSSSKKRVEDISSEKPYVIKPDEFDTREDYEAIWLTLYSDGVLADERDNALDIESTVGSDCLKKFSECDADVVYVRDDQKKIDYEIARDIRSFKEVVGNNPLHDEED